MPHSGGSARLAPDGGCDQDGSSTFLRQGSFMRALTETADEESGREKELDEGLCPLDVHDRLRGYRGRCSERG